MVVLSSSLSDFSCIVGLQCFRFTPTEVTALNLAEVDADLRRRLAAAAGPRASGSEPTHPTQLADRPGTETSGSGSGGPGNIEEVLGVSLLELTYRGIPLSNFSLLHTLQLHWPHADLPTNWPTKGHPDLPTILYRVSLDVACPWCVTVPTLLGCPWLGITKTPLAINRPDVDTARRALLAESLCPVRLFHTDPAFDMAVTRNADAFPHWGCMPVTAHSVWTVPPRLTPNSGSRHATSTAGTAGTSGATDGAALQHSFEDHLVLARALAMLSERASRLVTTAAIAIPAMAPFREPVSETAAPKSAPARLTGRALLPLPAELFHLGAVIQKAITLASDPRVVVREGGCPSWLRTLCVSFPMVLPASARIFLFTLGAFGEGRAIQVGQACHCSC